jgi:beta-lactamase regulating signal transducer with metallopeptidase domain
MENSNFSPQESLALIESMIQKAQNKFAENGHLYLLWGWVVFICGILQFVVLHYFQYKQHYLVWMMTWLLAIYQIIYIAKRKKEKK